jgi:hypothetical protein
MNAGLRRVFRVIPAVVARTVEPSAIGDDGFDGRDGGADGKR